MISEKKMVPIMPYKEGNLHENCAYYKIISRISYKGEKCNLAGVIRTKTTLKLSNLRLLMV